MTSREPKLLSFIVPVFNEADNVAPLYAAVQGIMAELGPAYDYEVLFTDNHSTDNTFERLGDLAQSDPRVRVLRFSRNFGYQRSIHTGYSYCRGDAAVQLDCDLQDPPQMVLEFVRKWEDGYDVVFGVRKTRKESWGITQLRRVFYRLANAMSEDELPLDAGDFRLVDRRVIDELKKIDDCRPYLRGQIATLGFRQLGIPYDRQERSRGESKFSFSDLVSLAMDAIVSHSIVPMRLATYVGFGTFCATVVGILWYALAKWVFGQDWPAGFATLTILQLLSISLNGLFLGVIGEYVGRIYQQTKRRPLTVVQESVNVELDPLVCPIGRQRFTEPARKAA